MVPEGINLTGTPVDKVKPLGGESKRVDTDEKPAPQKAERKIASEEVKAYDDKQLEKVVQELNRNINVLNTKLSFSVDDKTGKTVIKISEKETNKVIREIPPEALLRVAAKLNEIIGMIFDKKI